MNDKATPDAEVALREQPSTTVVLPSPTDEFHNPGLPPHVHRLADTDPKAAKRAERQVATMFGLSMLASLVFVVAYFVVPDDATMFFPGIGKASLANVVLGVSLGLSLLLIGLGVIHWAKTLMSDQEVVEERHDLRSSDEERAKTVGLILDGGKNAQLDRRPLLKMTLLGSLGLFALPLGVQLVGSLDPGRHNPGEEWLHTLWSDATPEKPLRLVRDGIWTDIKLDDVTDGAVFHVMPENIKELIAKNEGVLEAMAKAAVILIRLPEADILSEKERKLGVQGVVAYSKICTHVGCLVGLYEQQTHHLLCPCHQSTFDLTNDCAVIFGPAKRPLPQLPITVDDEGYLIAKSGFGEAVGPSFWER